MPGALLSVARKPDDARHILRGRLQAAIMSLNDNAFAIFAVLGELYDSARIRRSRTQTSVMPLHDNAFFHLAVHGQANNA